MSEEHPTLAVLALHGIDESDLDLRRNGNPDELLICPSCDFENGFESQWGMLTHYTKTHDHRVMEVICGAEVWKLVLDELHNGRYLTAKEIAKPLPSYVGRKSIRRDLKKYGMFVERTSANGRKGAGMALERMTVEEFDAHLAARKSA